MRRFLPIAMLSAARLMCASGGATKAGEMEEYRVKALFLYNFTQFVEWPREAFQHASDPFTVCILAPNPFERGELEQTFAGKRIDGRTLKTRIVTGAGQMAACQIVFVGAGAAKRARAMLGEQPKNGLLTVGENPGFAAAGGMVNFQVRDGRVRLEINVAAAEQEGLRISAKLLKLAEIVK